jgi:hypothetical protein
MAWLEHIMNKINCRPLAEVLLQLGVISDAMEGLSVAFGGTQCRPARVQKVCDDGFVQVICPTCQLAILQATVVERRSASMK